MQLQNLKALNTKLLRLQVLKNKVSEKKSFSKGYSLEDITFRLKKLINIIFKFHILNKKILFVEASLHQQQRFNCLVKNTKHVLVTKSFLENGLVTNRLFGLKHIYKEKKASETYSQLKKKFDLIVVLDEFSSLTVLKEGYTFKIPLSSLRANLNDLTAKTVYRVPGDFRFSEESCLFHSVLHSILRKVQNIK